MKRIAQSAREEGPATRPMKESKRAEAFKKITRSGATAEVDTHLKEPKRKTVMMKMESKRTFFEVSFVKSVVFLIFFEKIVFKVSNSC